MRKRDALALARDAYRTVASKRALALVGQAQPLAREGLVGAIVGSSTRNTTVDTIAAVGGASTAQLIDRVGTGFLGAVDFALRQFATDMAVRADVARVLRHDLDSRALERQVVRDTAWRGMARGAVSGLPAVIPVAGTAVEVGAAIADSIALTVAESRLVLGLCHLRGLDVQDIEPRRLDVLLVLGLSSGAAVIEDDAIVAAGQRIPVATLRDRDLPDDVAIALSSAVGATIARRVAQRRTSGFLLRLLPAGASVAAAAWYDWKETGVVGRHAIRYLDLVHPETVQRDSAPA